MLRGEHADYTGRTATNSTHVVGGLVLLQGKVDVPLCEVCLDLWFEYVEHEARLGELRDVCIGAVRYGACSKSLVELGHHLPPKGALNLCDSTGISQGTGQARDKLFGEALDAINVHVRRQVVQNVDHLINVRQDSLRSVAARTLARRFAASRYSCALAIFWS